MVLDIKKLSQLPSALSANDQFPAFPAGGGTYVEKAAMKKNVIVLLVKLVRDFKLHGRQIPEFKYDPLKPDEPFNFYFTTTDANLQDSQTYALQEIALWCWMFDINPKDLMQYAQ